MKQKEKGKDRKKDNCRTEGNDKGKGKMDVASANHGKNTGDKVCWTCKQPGHHARNYPNQAKDLAKNVTYVNVDDTKISEKSVVTMVDRRETHTFKALNIVKEYGLKVTNCATKMKAVNLATRPCYGMALEADPIPHLDGLMFMGEKDPRFVQRIKTFVMGSKKTVGLVA
ncbi:hypothetical protein KY290_031052 [Solanum tuberosum]|uniref:CCHC-type domain-containing protein n=1 Tax=Solanum tuberosum TaxID=4113 RepID=A0ABQ7U9Y7_SOLTU|nr:hypothetical protein KY290_031052 [Solanum tuberosum]